ncbi:hypothetical protein HK098_001522 [Nowakowskiella sp. JEL0407]|nr:hypothetical protein HK098_001522 [Nowakowskiella sp. JEL0407]
MNNLPGGSGSRASYQSSLSRPANESTPTSAEAQQGSSSSSWKDTALEVPVSQNHTSSLSNGETPSSNESKEQSTPVSSTTPGNQSTTSDSLVQNPHSLGNPSVQLDDMTQMFLGTLVSQSYSLINDKGELGIFFVFQELSIRISGRYCIRFTLFDTRGQNEYMQPGTVTEAWSEVFQIYSPKSFPKMAPSTPLSKAFAEQGIHINIRGETFRSPK